MPLLPARKRALLVGIAIAVLVISGTAGALAYRTPTTTGGPAASGFGAEQLAAARAAVELAAGTNGLATDPARLASIATVPGPATGPSYRWQPVPALPGQPAPRYFPNLVWDPADGYVLLYGGYNINSGITYSDTWTYLNGTWTNITNTVAGQPPPLWASGFAYDPSDHEVVLYGGNFYTGAQEDWTWAYHDKVWTNLTSTAGTPPAVRVLPGLATDSTLGGVLLFGGNYGTYSFNDTWTFVHDAWTNVTATAGTPGYFPGGGFVSSNPAGPGPLLFGAVSDGPPSLDRVFGGTYEFVAGAWKNLTAGNPDAPICSPNSEGGTVGYLPSIGAVVLYTFAATNATGVGAVGPFTWFFEAGTWVNETAAAGPIDSLLVAPGAFVSPYDSAFIVLGGLNVATDLMSTAVWALAAPPAVTAVGSPTVVDVGTAVSFSGAIRLGLADGTPEWTFGDGGNSTGLSASHTYAVPGLYTANLTVTDLVGQVGSASVAIQVNPAPTVGVSGPSGTPTAGSAVVFAALPRGGTPPFSFSWNFGNGVTSTSPAPTVTYASSGTYTVTLTLTDQVGKTATNSTSVTIVAPSSGSSSTSLTSGTGLYLLLAVIALVAVAIVLGVLLARKGGGSRPSPTPYAPSTPPAGAIGPPPGASGPPPPPT